MRHILLVVWGLFLAVAGYGQQYVDFLQIKNDLVVANPAAPATEYLRFGLTQSVSVVYKDQWTQFEDSPKTYALQYRMVHEPQNISLGVTILKDDTGAISNHSAQGNFAYNMILDRDRKQILSLGVSAGLAQYRIDLSEINFAQAPILESQLLNRYEAEVGFGAFLTDKDHYFVGLAVPQLLLSGAERLEAVSINKVPHLLLQIGGFIGTRELVLEPQANIAYQRDAPINLMAGIIARHKSGLQLGAGMNSAGRPHASVGYNAQLGQDNVLSCAIAYGDRLDNLRSVLGSTLEFSIHYAWGRSSMVTCPWF